jgi:N-acetylglucosaminyl-diphospho-decaprenol L-rhamnosyltransferase
LDISVIIVSWNVTALLRDCLTSLYASDLGGKTLEVIVVDSASSDGTPSMVKAEFPAVRLLEQTENVGYTRGNNIGLAAAAGEYLLLLNPDTTVYENALARMARYLDTHSDVGIVGPRTLNGDGTHQPARWRFPSRRLALMETAWLRPYAGRLLADYEYAEVSAETTHDADWVQGSCLMARREVYDKIGGLDTGYVMFFEELDWCKRAADAGFKTVYLGSAQIVHYGGASTDQIGARKHIYYNESKLRYFRKVYGRGFALVLRIFLLAIYGWQMALEWTKGVLGSQRSLRRERVNTYWQVLRSGLRVR